MTARSERGDQLRRAFQQGVDRRIGSHPALDPARAAELEVMDSILEPLKALGARKLGLSKAGSF